MSAVILNGPDVGAGDGSVRCDILAEVGARYGLAELVSRQGDVGIVDGLAGVYVTRQNVHADGCARQHVSRCHLSHIVIVGGRAKVVCYQRSVV